MHIEHELAKRAFEPGKALFQNDKTRTGEFCGGLEIHLAERFAELEMLLRLERVVASCPEAMMLDVVVLVLAVGHVGERQVGYFRERVVQIL